MQSQRHAPRKEKAPEMSPEERKEQAISWAMWRVTAPPERVSDDLKKWAVGTLPSGKKKEFEEFLRDPKKEFVLFFETEKDAESFARFLSNCGLMRKVDAYMGEPSPQDHMRYTLGKKDKVKLVVSAEALRQPRPLGKKETEAYALVKAGKEKRPASEEDAFVEDLRLDMKDDNPVGGLDSELPIPKKVAEKKGEGEEKLVARMPMRRKSESASKRNMPLFPDTETRDAFMEAYNSGTHFSFQLRGSASLEPTFKGALGESGMGSANVAFTEVEKNIWKVELNKGTGTDYAKLFQTEVDKLKEGLR